MLINGLGKKIGAIAAPTSFDQIARGTTSSTLSDSVKPDQKYRTPKTARKQRQRAKKG